ncbi:AraC family transcriptional regulator [Comamonas testosteroni]|uniref:AraC family transcriptional regulator n=1 Tax=Comamonas testosteroni TaxID=285 RepID=UPI003899D192
MSLDRLDDSLDQLLATAPSVVGVADVWEPGSWPSHSHDRHQLIYASKGVMHVDTAGRSLVLPTSRALWVAAGVMHALTLKRTAEIFVLYVDPAYFHIPAHEDCAVVEMSPLVRELIRACACGYEHYEEDSEQGRLSTVLLDQVKKLQTAPTEIPLPKDRRGKHLAEILKSELDNRQSVEELAARVGASARTIMRIFLDETHMSFGMWRQKLRLISSIEMLAYGESINNISANVGYESPSSYVAAFRSMFGITPAKYFN